MNAQMADLLLQAAQDPRVQRAAVKGARAAYSGAQQLANRPRRRAPRAAQRRQAQAPFNRRMVQRAPVAVSRQMGPRGGNATNTRITRGREFIADVNGSSSSTPAISTYILNPGMSRTFPRLNQESNVWEQYRFRKLKAIYTPAVSTATSGTVIICPEYNANQAPPTTEAGLLNHQGSKSGSPWADMDCIFNASNMHGNAARKYVRDGLVTGDLNSYDAGQLHVAAISNGGTGVMGKLWLEYEVEFYIPQVDPVAPIPRIVSVFEASGDQGLATGVPEAVDFATVDCNALGITQGSASQFTLPRGVYFVMCHFVWDMNAADDYVSQTYLQLDGSSFARGVQQGDIATIGGGGMGETLFGFTSSDGTNVCQALIELTVGSGTLKMNGNLSKIAFLCV